MTVLHSGVGHTISGSMVMGADVFLRRIMAKTRTFRNVRESEPAVGTRLLSASDEFRIGVNAAGDRDPDHPRSCPICPTRYSARRRWQGAGVRPIMAANTEAKVDRNLATMLKEIARLMAASDCRVSRRSSSLGDDHERPGMTRVTSTSAYWRHRRPAKYAA